LVARDRLVTDSVHAAGIPLVLTSGGGYSRPIELSVEAHANTYRTAWEVFCRENDAGSDSHILSSLM
jgi:hypothetical protein